MTERFVQHTHTLPGRRQQDFFDGKLPGLALRVTKDGSKSWSVFYRVAGRRARLTFGIYPVLSLPEARAQARLLLQAVERGEDPRRQRAQDRREPTFELAAAEYVERYAKPRKRSWRKDEKLIARDLLPMWRTLRLRDIARRDVRDLLDRMVERGAPQSARRTFALIHTMFNWFVSREVIAVSPCVGMEAPAPATRRERVLSQDELRRVWEAIEAEDEPWRAIFQLLVLTGQRQGEVRTMRREDVNLAERVWTIPAAITKNKVQHIVPLSAEALRIIEARLSAHTAPFVFTANTQRGHVTALDRPLERLQQRSGVAGWAPHDLRRGVGTGLAALGIPAATIAKILNHASNGVTERIYIKHGFETEKRQALDAWARRLHAIVSGESAAKVVPLRSA